MLNDVYFYELVRGCYGRKIAYTNVEKITADNVVKIVGDCIGVFNYNKPIIRYLWHYYKGDQPVLYRIKMQNEDVNNKVCENHAYELVNLRLDKHMVNRYSTLAEKTMKKLIKRLIR